MSSRRSFLKKTGLLGLSVLASRMFGEEQLKALDTLGRSGGNTFTLPALPYAYNALEPFIDSQTMEIHHTKHHKAYVDKLNTAPPADIDFTVSDALKCSKVNASTSSLIRNNLGGHYNHSLFWQLLKANPEGKNNLPEGALAEAINKDFGSFDAFKKEFSDKSSKIFGSGWCWLIEKEGKFKITTTPNQDNPLMDLGHERGKIVLGLDVWEHAYYLKYQNKRADYISAWWNVINWQKASELLAAK